eukprot:COSAG01_NODE_7384_length_3229_cov_16.488498_4_plen_177_part_00
MGGRQRRPAAAAFRRRRRRDGSGRAAAPPPPHYTTCVTVTLAPAPKEDGECRARGWGGRDTDHPAITDHAGKCGPCPTPAWLKARRARDGAARARQQQRRGSRTFSLRFSLRSNPRSPMLARLCAGGHWRYIGFRHSRHYFIAVCCAYSNTGSQDPQSTVDTAVEQCTGLIAHKAG